MSFFNPQPYSYQDEYPSNHQPVLEELRSQDITLEVRQNPRQALLTAPKKEKNRKPVDPPIVVQMKVSRRADSTQLFLHNPNLFAVANLENEHGQTVPGPCLTGNITSSLHRLKEVDSNGSWGKDGGFFVFGDVSVSKLGRFRFCFSIFELRKVEACALGSVRSDIFEVVSPKDYLGLEESSFLTRAFVDQGVRLRLRKEQRSMGASRTRRDTRGSQGEDEQITPTSLTFKAEPVHQDRRTPPHDDDQRPLKRPRTSFGAMYPGVSHSTRGWGAFNSADMHGWRAPGGESSMASFPPLLSEPEVSMGSRLAITVPSTQSNLQLPMASNQLPTSRTPTEWRGDSPQRQLYQSSLAATGLSSPPSSGSGSYDNPIPRPHFSHSLQHVDTTSPTQSRQQMSPQYQQSPQRLTQPQQSPYTPSYARPYDNQRQAQSGLTSDLYSPAQYNPYGSQRGFPEPSIDRQTMLGSRNFGLETLASASEQHSYVAPTTRTFSGPVSGTQSHLQGTPISLSPTPHGFPAAQQMPVFSQPGTAGQTSETAQNLRQLQQAFRSDTTSTPTQFPFSGVP